MNLFLSRLIDKAYFPFQTLHYSTVSSRIAIISISAPWHFITYSIVLQSATHCCDLHSLSCPAQCKQHENCVFVQLLASDKSLHYRKFKKHFAALTEINIYKITVCIQLNQTGSKEFKMKYNINKYTYQQVLFPRHNQYVQYIKIPQEW